MESDCELLKIKNVDAISSIFLLDGKIAIQTVNSTIRIYDRLTSKLEQEVSLSDSNGRMTQLKYGPLNNLILIYYKDSYDLYNSMNGEKPTFSLPNLIGFGEAPNGEMVFSTKESSDFVVLNIVPSLRYKSYSFDMNNVHLLKFLKHNLVDKEKSYLLSGNLDGQVQVSEYETNTKISSIELPAVPKYFSELPDGRVAIAAANLIYIWNYQTNAINSWQAADASLIGLEATSSGELISADPKSKQIRTWSDDGKLKRIYDIKDRFNYFSLLS
jgi:hypothetical protein